MRRKSCLFFLLMVVFYCGVLRPLPSSAGPITGEGLLSIEAHSEYAYIEKQILFYKNNKMPSALVEQTFRNDALILPADSDPLDVLARRTSALLNFLLQDNSSTQMRLLEQELSGLLNQTSTISNKSIRQELFNSLILLRKKIAFQNPLLNFKSIVFLTHHKARFNHMCDQYFGFHANPGGGIYVLENAFGENPTIRNVLENSFVENGRLSNQQLKGGSFISLELDYDANIMYFAWSEAREARQPFRGDTNGKWFAQDEFDEGGVRSYWNLESTYHIFKVNINGTGLTQLTDGPWNDFDPCVLPNGRIVFISERRGGYLRCGARPDPTYTLHAMMPDGSDIIPLSYHETHEWHPSVANDGKIVYTRWDYVDRDSDVAHHLWSCFPDGRDPRSMHGNYPTARENRPWMEMSIRAIPGQQHLYAATAAPHHGQAYGSLVLINQQQKDDRAMGQIKRLTPDAHFPESEMAPGIPHPEGRHKPKSEVYGSPWPLSKDFYLCVFDSEQQNYSLVLLDTFGNRIFLYNDSEVPCLDPVPLMERYRPPVIPSQTTQALVDRQTDKNNSKATVAVMNIYDSELAWPDNTEIKSLRVVQLFPKTSRQAAIPNIGAGDQSLARGVLGTVPVEKDGSVYFEAPAGIPFYLQALDEKGLAVQTMRSLTYVHRGEKMVCQGCHESKQQAARNVFPETPVALKRAPSKLTPDVEGSWPLTFPRLVQPVLDNKCVSCHKASKAPNLTADRGEDGWSLAYHSLAPFAWFKHGGNGSIERNITSYSIPGEIGAYGSQLYEMLKKGHHDVKLSEKELYRITLWLDCNSTFYGAYHDINAQAYGHLIIPFLQ